VDPASIRKPFFLFPLNVPEDAQILLRAPQFRDVLSICELVSNVLPYGHSLVIKEHPGHLGMIAYRRLRAALKQHKDMQYASGEVRLWGLVKEAKGLITVNSTAALEALVRNIPVIALGEAFYKGTGLTHDVEYLLDLQDVLSNIGTKNSGKDKQELLLSVIAQLLQETVPAPGVVELMDMPKDNYVRVMAEGVALRLMDSRKKR
jgi:hypothetical protein